MSEKELIAEIKKTLAKIANNDPSMSWKALSSICLSSLIS
ncbi:unnamed protein product [marine sediment metagenome]|uniref:Uncharacterized protein n=1 Tax=marine sediment metagenome TaxID=412755 RepID=X1QP10_9ZZZZ